MTKIRPVILLLAVVASAFLAYGLWTMPKPQAADHEGFSSARVVEDIKVISQKHHSVAHPQEREEEAAWMSESFIEIEKVFPMYRLSIDGLKDAMYKLLRNN